MKKFKDSEGREWSLSVTIGDAKRIKEDLSLDLLNHVAITEIAADPYQLVGVLWLLCEAQSAKAGVTDEQFGRGLAGDAIDHATDALLGAIIDFFPKRQRGALQALLAKVMQANEQGATLAESKANSPQMEMAIQGAMAKAEKEIDRMLGELSGNLPDLPG
jgi:hypothetical protein